MIFPFINSLSEPAALYECNVYLDYILRRYYDGIAMLREFILRCNSICWIYRHASSLRLHFALFHVSILSASHVTHAILHLDVRR